MKNTQVVENENDQGVLLVHAIEEKARLIPQHTWIRYAPPDWRTVGYCSITWGQYASAVDKIAHWLDEQLGPTRNNDTVTYSGPNDPRYGLFIPAAIKTGRKVLILDGRVSGEGLQSMISATDCKTWICPEGENAGPLVDSQTGIQKLTFPSLEWCLDAAQHARYPYDWTFEQASRDVIVIIHTSGTTGNPKPIYQNNGMWTAMGSSTLLAKKNWPRGISHESWFGKAEINCCPPQWIAGLTAQLLPAFWDTTCILLPADASGLTPDIFKELLSRNRVQGIRCPPHTIHSLYADPESTALLKSLEFILFLGAALDRTIGDDLCKHVRLTPLIGSTETGDQVSLRPASRELWYTHDYVSQNGHRFVASDSTDGLFELVLDRPKRGHENVFQAAFWNPAFDGIETIETKEMYKPIKDIDGRTRWIFTSRKDDLTKLSWLAKFHAEDIEKVLRQNSDVQEVVVGGEGRPAPYVIVEPKPDVLNQKSAAQFIDELYDGAIALSNNANSAEIKIPKKTLIVAQPVKPLVRNLKQVVSRKDVEKDYQDEINAAYADL